MSCVFFLVLAAISMFLLHKLVSPQLTIDLLILFNRFPLFFRLTLHRTISLSPGGHLPNAQHEKMLHDANSSMTEEI